MDILLLILLWVLFWFSGWGLFLILRKVKNLKFTDYFLFRPLYFLIFTLLIWSLFKDYFLFFSNEFILIPFLILAGVILLELLLYYLFHKYFKKPKILKEKYSNIIFLQMDYSYIFYKFFDILFQQSMILLLISILFKNIPEHTVLLFVITFFIVHVHLIQFFGKKMGIFFVAVSTLGAWIFVSLILNFNYGFVYSYIVHWFFYTVLGSFFWLYHLKFKK